MTIVSNSMGNKRAVLRFVKCSQLKIICHKTRLCNGVLLKQRAMDSNVLSVHLLSCYLLILCVAIHLLQFIFLFCFVFSHVLRFFGDILFASFLRFYLRSLNLLNRPVIFKSITFSHLFLDHRFKTSRHL